MSGAVATVHLVPTRAMWLADLVKVVDLIRPDSPPDASHSVDGLWIEGEYVDEVESLAASPRTMWSGAAEQRVWLTVARLLQIGMRKGWVVTCVDGGLWTAQDSKRVLDPVSTREQLTLEVGPGRDKGCQCHCHKGRPAHPACACERTRTSSRKQPLRDGDDR